MREVVVQFTPRPLPDAAPSHGGIAFIDRDGVLNIGSPNYINTPEELVLLPGASEAIADLRRGGYLICIVTNPVDTLTIDPSNTPGVMLKDFCFTH